MLLSLSACRSAAPEEAEPDIAAPVPTVEAEVDYGIFSSMDSAFEALSGVWISSNDNYVSFTRDADDAVSFSTDLPCPDGDFVDFYKGALCAFTVMSDRNVEYEKAFSFELIIPDSLRVTCHYDGSTNVFTRIKENLDKDKLTAEYVFSDNRRAFAFLEGRWEDESGEIYFSVEDVDGSLSWGTNLPLDDECESYGFTDGGMYGVKLTDSGEAIAVKIYDFELISQNEIIVTLPESGENCTLKRTS